MRSRRPLVAWFVLIALLLAGQGPLVAQFAPAAVRVALCTVDGVRLVAFGAGAGEETPSAPRHASMPHCPLCATSHAAAATPPAPIALVVAAGAAPAVRAAATTTAPLPRILARSRAQPPPLLLS